MKKEKLKAEARKNERGENRTHLATDLRFNANLF